MYVQLFPILIYTIQTPLYIITIQDNTKNLRLYNNSTEYYQALSLYMCGPSFQF